MRAQFTAKLLGGSLVVYTLSASLPSAPTGAAVATAAADTYENGSRLTAIFLESSDGARQFFGWHDTARDVDCSFALTSDGAWRCLPRGAETGRFFGDAACTQPLALARKGCEAPSFAVQTDLSACGRRMSSTRIFDLGAAFTGPLAYWAPWGVCTAVPSAELMHSDLYFVGEEEPPSSFVGAELRAEP